MSSEELNHPELPSTPDAVDVPAETENAVTEPAVGDQSNYIIVGLDLGTNTSCIQAVDAATGNEVCNTVVPTIVGYADRGILAGILPDDSAELFGTEALRNELHLRISRPLKNGVIEDVDAAAKFVKHLRDIVDPGGKATIHAVVGIPSNTDRKSVV